MSRPSSNAIAFQGEAGAYSQAACQALRPGLAPLACPTFEDALQAVSQGRADFAAIPIENSTYGRVADVHHLLPESRLYIVAEHFQPIRLQLMARPGAALGGLTRVVSHPVALGQCREFLRAHGLESVATADTAGAARQVAETEEPGVAAIGSALAAAEYGLEILAEDIEDHGHNTTRFLLMAPEPDDAEPDKGPVVTTFVFRVRNVPAALYKAMGGFATNGVNMVKLESYMLDGVFTATQFYADIEGHPEDRKVRLALEELQFFTSHMEILGVYPAHPYRQEIAARAMVR